MDEYEAALLERVRNTMKNGARLEVVRMLFNPQYKWGVQVYEKGKTRGGNDKWVRVTLMLPIVEKGQTVADVLKMLGDMAEEAE